MLRRLFQYPCNERVVSLPRKFGWLNVVGIAHRVELLKRSFPANRFHVVGIVVFAVAKNRAELIPVQVEELCEGESGSVGIGAAFVGEFLPANGLPTK